VICLSYLLRFAAVCFFLLACRAITFAGTTGTLSGTVTDAATRQPLVDAKVTVTSPSQVASTTTDRSGHYAFLALAPDTYSVTVTAPGYDAATVSGTTVIADQTRTLAVASSKALQTIGRVSSRASTDLVKPGTSADVYSVNAVTQDKGAALGGGGNLNSAWSALAAVPGVAVAPGQSGYVGAAATLSIRGGDYDQIGYEVDGVPVNRAFDNYPSGPASSLGQQELQVYTGAAPANAEAQGLSGFVNQVIKTGTYPAQSQLTTDIGGPTFYHKLSAETGGSTSDHNFSYYVGVGGYNQDQRYVDQFQGLGVSQLYGTALARCTPGLTPALAPSCYTNGIYNGNNGAGAFVLGSANQFNDSELAVRDSVINLHFGLPHKNGTRDDIQLLYVNDYINTQVYDSQNTLGGPTFLNALGIGTTYANGYQYDGQLGTALPASYQGSLVNYAFPNAVTNGAPNTPADPAPIPPNVQDSLANNQAIAKIQYTHAFGSNALFKLYGYTYYSNWSYLSPNSLSSNFFGEPADYELSSHTRGVSGQFTDQLGSNNLLSFQGAYTTSTTLRDNNSQFANAGDEFATLVNANAPLSGFCYTTAGASASCSSASTYVTFAQAAAAPVVAPAVTCGSGPCEYLAVENGLHATYSTVVPKFSSASLTDQWKPTARLSIDAGLRFDRFEYEGSDTTGTPAREFFYNAYNLDNCVTTAAPIAVVARATPGGVCPAGSVPANFTNPSGNVSQGFNEYQPRIGLTYSLNPTTVIRANYGRFTQAPNSAYEQYETLQQNAPAQLYDVYGFQAFGFTTPDHTVVPPTSDNLDFSLEKQLGSDTSIKISPFRRVTQNQIQNFFLNQQTGFVSGLNVGHQTSQGVEFELDKGNFSRNGFAGKLALAYTNSYIRYTPLSNGTTIIDPLNAQIKNYNAYTSFCARNPTATPCVGGTTVSGAAAAPCYTVTGAAAPACGAGTLANPYWNAPVQGLLDPNGNYPTFDIFPGGIGSYYQGYGQPYTATAILQYKHDKLALTPAVQFFAGQRYGAPLTTEGIAPDTCTTGLGTAAGDPRYPYGSVGGAGYNYASCTNLAGGIPDPYTGKFDTIGAFSEPSQLLLHLQISYDITPRVSLVANLANIVSTCFGGTKTAFTVKGACDYSVVANGATGAVGNTYNPGTVVQPYVLSPYLPVWTDINGSSSTTVNPFNAYVSLRIKL
jgi:hypothetical protein